MKRTLCLSALFVVCATIAVSGQSLNEKLQQLLGGSHSAKQEEATPPTYPSEEAGDHLFLISAYAQFSLACPNFS